MEPIVIPWDQVTDLLIAALLGGVIGADRDLRNRPAGLRTNMLICISACLFTMISMTQFPQDSARIASQIVTGVGFIGAGVLIQEENRIRGLTTAADIWLVAAVGMAIGVRIYPIAVFVTLLALVCSSGLAPLSRYLEDEGKKRRKK